MIKQYEITLPEFPRGYHIIDTYITSEINALPQTGLLHIFIKHTSAALTINEGADPSVRTDMETIFNNIVPENSPVYTHILEGSDDMPAHAKVVIAGSTVTIPITDGKLNLGRWQSIYLCEFRNKGGKRKIVATIYS